MRVCVHHGRSLSQYIGSASARSRERFAVFTTILIAIFAATAHAELVLSIYGGAGITDDGDLKLRLPGDTSLRFEDVDWSDRSFESPPYYGARLT